MINLKKGFLGLFLIINCFSVYGFKPSAAFPFSAALNGCTAISGCHHQGMTNDALRVITTSVDGETLSFTDKAIDEVKKSNSGVDIGAGFFDEVAHCDAETLEDCSKRIKNKKDKIILLLKKDEPDGKSARKELGQALHTIQDFYAHSNWANNKSTTNKNLLNGTLTSLSPTVRTCEDDFGTLIASGLTNTTTGYFSLTGGGNANTPVGKCSHGKDGVADPGINKDGVSRLFHNKARNLGISASNEYVLSIIEEEGIKNNSGALRAFLGLHGDLGFSVDITGSMGGEIAGVKKSMEKIARDETGVSLFDNFVLSTFGDPQRGVLVTKTIVRDTFINRISSLSVGGGGDCPEYSMSGIQTTLNNVSDASQIFVYTDAAPKDASLRSSIIAQANKKRVSIIFILTGTCSPVHEAYIDIANKTGGQVFLIDESEVENLDVLIQPIVSGNRQLLLTNENTINGGTLEASFPVDETIELLTISTTSDSTVVTEVIRPDGSIVKSGDTDTEIVALTSGPIIQIQNPVVGEWKVKNNGTGSYSTSVFGNSKIGLENVEFLEFKGREGHKGLFPIEGLPTAKTNTIFNGLINRESDADIISEFEFRNSKGELIQTLIPKDNELAGVMSVNNFVEVDNMPDVPFRVYAKGTDKSGNEFVRAFASEFITQTILINSETPTISISGGSSRDINFQVTNLGDTANFNVSVAASDGSVVNLNLSTLTLEKDETAVVTAGVSPSVSLTDNNFNLTLVVTDQSDNAKSNSAITLITVVADTDGDGMSDLFEDENGLNKNDPDDALLDNDGDELNNFEEFQNNTNPNSADTDKDSVDDGVELAAGTDPLDPLSFPARSQAIPTLSEWSMVLLILSLLIFGVRTRKHL